MFVYLKNKIKMVVCIHQYKIYLNQMFTVCLYLIGNYDVKRVLSIKC